MKHLDTEPLANIIAEAYQLLPPLHITPLTRGANNRSFLIETNNGDFVLKWHQNTHAIEQQEFLLALLSALEAMDLPFAFPVPIRTRLGDLSHTISGRDEPVTLTLTRRIVGEHPGVGNPTTTLACGKALGILDDAMAKIEIDPNISIPVAFPPLEANHPAVLDPIAAIRSNIQRDDVAELLETIETDWQNQTKGWTQQLIHGDFFSPNVLISNGEVTGILDFEFSGTGHRAMDFAVGLKAFCLNPAPSEKSWELLRAFATGYLTHAHLSPEELRAIPTLLLKRESSSFVHWLGRMTEGLTDLRDIYGRADRLLELSHWLKGNGQNLIDVLDSIAERQV